MWAVSASMKGIPYILHGRAASPSDVSRDRLRNKTTQTQKRDAAIAALRRRDGSSSTKAGEEQRREETAQETRHNARNKIIRRPNARNKISPEDAYRSNTICRIRHNGGHDS